MTIQDRIEVQSKLIAIKDMQIYLLKEENKLKSKLESEEINEQNKTKSRVQKQMWKQN